MKLYYNTVSPTLMRILNELMRLDSLKDFRLVGDGEQLTVNSEQLTTASRYVH